MINRVLFLKKKEPEKPRLWDISGSISLGASYGFAHDDPKPGEPDFRGLSRLRPDLHLELDISISKDWKAFISGRSFYDLAYEMNGRNQYRQEVLDEYEKEAELQDIYLQGRLLDNLDLKIGRQIVVWGKSDNIRVVDILNPLDLREPGLVDIEDLRLPVTMTRIDYYFGQWNLSGIAVHEIRFNKTPVFGSEFFSSTNPLPTEVKPASTLENTEYAISLNGIFRGWDLSFYAARFFDDQPHIEMISPLHRERHHSRLNMVGAAMNIAKGDWLLKWETAYFKGLEFFALPGEKKSRFDVMTGMEYTGFTDTTVTLEAVNRHVKDFDACMKSLPDNAQEDQLQTVLRYSGNFLHDSLHIVFIASIYGSTGNDGAFQRFSAEYDILDAFSVKAGLVNYYSGNLSEFNQIGDKDRLFLEVKYSF